MIKEFDAVRLTKPLPNLHIPVGTKGVVVMIHDASPPAYEVEFFDEAGNTIEDEKTAQFTFTIDDHYIEAF